MGGRVDPSCSAADDEHAGDPVDDRGHHAEDRAHEHEEPAAHERLAQLQPGQPGVGRAEALDRRRLLPEGLGQQDAEQGGEAAFSDQQVDFRALFRVSELLEG